MDTLFLTFPVSSEGPITQYVGRILREHTGKANVEVHDYADTKIPMLARMHGKRLTTYRKFGLTPSAEPSLFNTERASHTESSPELAHDDQLHATNPEPTTVQVRAWAREAGLEVPSRGRLRPEIWAAYNQAHLTAGSGDAD